MKLEQNSFLKGAFNTAVAISVIGLATAGFAATGDGVGSLINLFYAIAPNAAGVSFPAHLAFITGTMGLLSSLMPIAAAYTPSLSLTRALKN